MASDEKDIEKGAELHPNRESATNERGQTGSLRALIALLAAAGIALGFFIFDAGWFPTTGMTCSPNMYRRSSLIFFDHRPALTAENAFDRSTNVVIELPCLLSLPVYSSMYSASFCWASCFAIDAGPRVFSFFVRVRRPPAFVVRRWKNPTHTFPPRRRSIFLIQPSGGTVRGNWRPTPRRSESTGGPSGFGSRVSDGGESEATVALSAMAQYRYLPLTEQLNVGGQMGGCFWVSRL